jgi:signal peptidase I
MQRGRRRESVASAVAPRPSGIIGGVEPASEGRTGAHGAPEGEARTEPATGDAPDARQLLIRQAEDTADDLRRRAEADSARLRTEAVAEGSRRRERADEVADLLGLRATCAVRAAVEDAESEAAVVLRRVELLESEAHAVHLRAERTVEDAAEAATRRLREARTEAGAILQEASVDAARLRRDLAAEGEAELAAVLRIAEADAASLRRPAEVLCRDAEAGRTAALEDLERARQYWHQAAMDALHATFPAPAPVARQSETPRSSLVRRVAPWALVVLAGLLLRAYVVEPFAIDGASMQPALLDGDRVVVNKLPYRFGEPERGDVVIIDGDEMSSDGVLAKRVIGLPGESVEVLADGTVRVDGRVLEEGYLAARRATVPFVSEEVPDDHVFVLGDNRAVSMDSRGFGSVPIDDVVGRVEAVVWPLDDLRAV